MVAVDEKLIQQRNRKIACALTASCAWQDSIQFCETNFAPSLLCGENQNLDSQGNPDSLLHATSGFRHPCLPDLWLRAISGFRHPCLNMTTDQNGNIYVYDAWNRLVEVKNASGQIIAEYSYDARGYPESGWCFKEIGTGLVSNDDPQGGSGVPAGTTNYIYYDSNWQAIEVRTNGTAASDVTSQTVWSAAYPGAAAQPRSFVSAGFRAVEAANNFGPSAGALNINSPVLQDSFSGGVIQPNSRIYFLHDANWNTTAVVGYNATTQTWGVIQRYVYSPYGNIQILNSDWSVTPTGTQPIIGYLYQGMTLDAVTGLYYARNRNYSPSLGIWISQDPLQYVNGANTYQMEMSGPVRNVDSSGLNVIFPVGPSPRVVFSPGGIGVPYTGPTVPTTPPGAAPPTLLTPNTSPSPYAGSIAPFDAPAPPAHPKRCCPGAISDWKTWVDAYQKAKAAYSTLVLDTTIKNGAEIAYIPSANALGLAQSQMLLANLDQVLLDVTGAKSEIEVAPVDIAAELRLDQLKAQEKSLASSVQTLNDELRNADVAWQNAKYNYDNSVADTVGAREWYITQVSVC